MGVAYTGDGIVAGNRDYYYKMRSRNSSSSESLYIVGSGSVDRFCGKIVLSLPMASIVAWIKTKCVANIAGYTCLGINRRGVGIMDDGRSGACFN